MLAALSYHNNIDMQVSISLAMRLGVHVLATAKCKTLQQFLGEQLHSHTYSAHTEVPNKMLKLACKL